MKWLVVLLLLVPGISEASFVALCDPNSALVPDRVVRIIKSAHTPDWVGVPNTVINPDRSAVTEPLRRHWKCSGSPYDALIDMTTQEKTTVDQPAIDRDNQRAADLAELEGHRADLAQAFTDWATLTQAQKNDMTRKQIRAFLLREKLGSLGP